ncbi:MAG: fumarylacetoacetate hydrolase family protein [Firmicutes bacterium]|nr:fumarylacetoacetate hydrolase family protein [Clostridiales bacterium]MBQ4340644.1 fumarylacetoacetate hydrolase family protein [Bacillota bacterium]
MKFATLSYNEKETVCVINSENDTFIPIKTRSVPDMQTLIENFDEIIPELEEELTAAGSELEIPLTEAAFLAPIPYPRRNIVCLGKNYLEHVKEIGGITGGPKDQAPDYPIYFTKAAYPCNHHMGTILRHPEITEKIDYEVELGVVIGKRGINISVEDALDHVFGYTIGNDISARDVQNRHVNWFMGKSLVTHCPVGPYIVHKDEIPDPQVLGIQSYVNDELRQNGNTADMIWGVAEIIHELSKGYELFPGDIILTGTPKGVGMGFKPPKFLNAGDKVLCRIEGIGELINYIED